MTFKEINKGSLVYMLDKSTMTVTKGNVQAVSLPRYDMNSTSPSSLGMVIDVTIQADGNSGQYVVKDTAETVYANDGCLLITPNINNVLTELRYIKAQSEDVISSVDKHKDTVDKCSKLLEELDPVFKKDQVTEKRFAEIEQAISKLSDSNDKITEILTKLSNNGTN